MSKPERPLLVTTSTGESDDIQAFGGAQEVLIIPEPGEAKLYRRVKGGWVEVRQVREEELA
jgi:hypothetical protein